MRVVVSSLRTNLGPGLAEVEDGLCRGQVLNVPVLQEGGGAVGGEVGEAGLAVLVLHWVLQAVRPEQSSLLGLHLGIILRSFAGEILGLLEVGRMEVLMVVVVELILGLL